MKKLSLLCLLSLTLGVTSMWAGTISTNPSAFQDSVDWCQFGCPFNQLSSPQAWSSAAGNTGLVGNATTQDFQVLQQGANWNGNFAANMGLVYNGVQTLGNGAGTINVLFDQAVYGVGAYMQQTFYGAFTGTITLLDNNLDSLGTFSANGNSDNNVGTALFLGAFDPTADVWGAIFSTSGIGDDDFGLGQLRLQTAPAPPPIPEPSTLLLVGPSLLGVVAAARRRISRSAQEMM
ncbi:MAG: hypothetical protein ABI383_03010 [Acidobacteriaceae bacterium]